MFTDKIHKFTDNKAMLKEKNKVMETTERILAL